MDERKAKQVIVMRTDLNMRKGKMVAQGAHASVGAIDASDWSEAWSIWTQSGMTKVCVGVDSEGDLRLLYDAALRAGLPTHLVVDSGRTEFHGEPTCTCIAIGPAWSDQIDAITGGLKLL